MPQNEASPRLRARLAGGLYLFALITAASTELFIHGRLNIVGGLIAVTTMVAMTLELYSLFKVVQRSVAVLASLCNLIGLGFEAARWQPHGVNYALVFTGLFCILTGYLVFRSTFLPKILGSLIAVSGLAWLTNLSPALADRLAPYNVAVGLLGELALFMWMLAMGVNADRWRQQAND
jgi:Domain of unknown function (DUF4386)